ncbi:TPA: transglycosylase SLT domain-containing protein, partial [Escherichia coli]
MYKSNWRTSMFRIFFLLLVTLFAFNAYASKSAPSTKHHREFEMIQDRFERVKPLIVEISRKQGVDPKLMTTLIYRESRFNPKAYNRTSKAHSLVQMLPSTKR